VPLGWARSAVPPSTLATLRRDNALDLELYASAASLVHARVERVAGPAAAAALPPLNVSEPPP